MSKLFLCCSFVLKHKTGIGAYVLTLLVALERLKIQYKLQELNLPKNIKYKIILESIWYNTALLFKIFITKPEVAIFPAFTMPNLKVKNTRYYTVIHDLCVYRNNEVNNKKIKEAINE